MNYKNSDELYTQLAFLCDGKPDREVGLAVHRLLKKYNLALVEITKLKRLELTEKKYRTLQEQIGGALTTMVNCTEAAHKDLGSCVKHLTRLKDDALRVVEQVERSEP